MPIDVVCALDSPRRARELKGLLGPSNVILAASATELEKALSDETPDMVVADTQILGAPIEDWIREVSPDVILVHDQDDPKLRAAAARAGCLTVLDSRLPVAELAETVQALIQRRLDLERLVHATSPPSEARLQDFASASPRMQEFLALARKVVDADSSLLLLGETGTGKERLARAIHVEGRRSAAPFVAVNCAALPESLAESELFGHEKGAFTGASQKRRGYFEQADGGTLFLDEIGDVPAQLQVKLLRVLEERRVQRLGAERSFPVDIRMLSATHRDPEQEVKAGRLREDLFYRLAVVTLTIPPLRERPEDIPALFRSYLESFRVTLNRPVYGVEKPALDALARYRWPGNVRELINVAERAALLSPGPEVGLADLPRAIASQAPAAAAFQPREPLAPGGSQPSWLGEPLQDTRQQVLADFESRYLSQLLQETRGQIGETARRASINERSLYELMRRHGLRKEDFQDRQRP